MTYGIGGHNRRAGARAVDTGSPPDDPDQGFGVVVVVLAVVVVCVVVVVAAGAGGQIAARENARSAAAVPVEVVTSTIVGVVVRLKFAIAPRVVKPAVSVPALASSEQFVTSTANATS